MTVITSISIDPETRAALKLLAAAEERSASAVIRHLVKREAAKLAAKPTTPKKESTQ